MPYPVAPSTVAANHLEVSVLVILAALLSRQPVPQKPLTSLLGFVRVTEFTKPVPDGSYHAQAVHDPPTREMSAADQSREEQRFFSRGIEIADD